MELNKILSDGRWGDMAALVNANFEKIKLELMKLRFASILTFCKGYFSTEARFLAKYPTGKDGQYAFVGSPWPGTVYEWIDTNWVNTKVAPQLGEGIFMELLKQHIDNKTILWEDKEKYIYSLGGGGSTFTIAVEIDTSSVGKCTVEANGDIVSITPSADNSVYTILANSGGEVKVRIVPEVGYQVKVLNVDGKSQDTVSEYTFENLDANHTMSVKMEVAEEVPTEFLVRSDLPGIYYSSMQSALNSVKADYPYRLLKNVTISCVKPARENRTNGTWIAELADWNKGSVFYLTIDGADKLVLDGKSLGGLSFVSVDNVLLRNTSFVNCANYAGAYSPAELYALSFVGTSDSYVRNFMVHQCRFNGAYPSDSTKKANNTIGSKYSENLTVLGCDISNDYGNCMKLNDCRYCSLIKNRISVDYSLNVVAHPSIMVLKNSHSLIVEDNRMSGDIRENYFDLTNVSRLYFRRNTVQGGGGRVITMSSLSCMEEVVIESNLFSGMINAPAGGWMKEYINLTRIASLRINNNTFVMNGNYYEQYVTKGGNIDNVELYNNILVNGAANAGSINGFVFNMTKGISSGNNLYQGMRWLLVSPNADAVDGYITIDSTTGRDVDKLQAAGYESGSAGIDSGVLDSGYRITSAMDALYKADDARTPFADADYKERTVQGNSRGCYNLAGVGIDEANDASTGYTGENYSQNQLFGSAEQYSSMADDVLCLRHDTPDRLRIIVFSIAGTRHDFMILGKSGIIYPMPELDENEEYLADELYTVNIE